MFEISMDEMIYVLADEMKTVNGVKFIDRTNRIPQKPFNSDMKPLKRPEKKLEAGAARDVAAEGQKPKQKPSKKEEKSQPIKSDSATVERVTGEVVGQPYISPERQEAVKSIIERTGLNNVHYEPIDGVTTTSMNSPALSAGNYADEINAAMNVGNGNIVQQQTQQNVTTTPSPTQVGVNDVISKFVTPHVKPERLTPKTVYGDALANGQEYTQQIQQQVQQTQNQQHAMLDVNAINSHIASLPMDKKDEYIRTCCMDEHYPDMKGLVQTTLDSKVERLKAICDFLPREQRDSNRYFYSINLQSMLFALTSKWIKKTLAKNGISENTKFKEIISNNANFRLAFVAEGDKVSLTVYVNPVPILTQYTDDVGNIKYSWNVDTAVETVNRTAQQ